MAVPKGRVSKSKRDKRKAQSWKIATPSGKMQQMR